ncbi:MAG: hypothetical protein ABGX83_04905 [Nitrospira sp.]|nr:hypothetical protein [Candidatus Manganitrophaceae bacterium]HIL34861.1 hypothetical protein [Candidatus Manganitrophaceae bacterium]
MKKWVLGILIVSTLFVAGLVSDMQPLMVAAEDGVSESVAQLNNEGVRLFKKGRFSEALTRFVASAEIDELFWEAHYNCALALVAMKKPEEALRHIELSLTVDPENLKVIEFYLNLLDKVNQNA